MTLKYLLDTNIISEPLRPKPNQTVLDRMKEHQADLAIPSIVWHELWFGCLRLPDSKRQKVIEAYLRQVVEASMPILPYETEAARWHASECQRLAGIGKSPTFADGQIAAIAHINHLTLVTLNTSDFQNFEDLRLEDWCS